MKPKRLPKPDDQTTFLDDESQERTKKFEFELFFREHTVKRSFVIIEAESEKEAYAKYDKNEADILSKCKWEDITSADQYNTAEINSIREL